MCSNPELCVVEKEEDNSGTGYKDGQYPFAFVLYNCVVLRYKTNDEITHVCLLVRLQQLTKRSNRQESCYKWVTCYSLLGLNPMIGIPFLF